MEPIDEILKKVANATSKDHSQTLSSAESAASKSMPGDPDCPICGGIGFVREDLPIDHPNFGRLQICSCRAQSVASYAHEHLYRLSNLEAFRELTFDSFNPRGRMGLSETEMISLEKAFNFSKSFAHDLNSWLLLIGNYGCGKTHLAAAIANEAVGRGVPTLFLTVPDLLDWLRFAYGNSSQPFEERFEEIRNIQLLVLDDLGTQNATPWAQEKLFQIINHRYVNRLPMVITTNINLEELDGRIASRLNDELVQKINITAPDYRNPREDRSHSQLSTLHLHARRTFESFSMRSKERLDSQFQENLEKVYRSARQYADKPRGWLVLMGESFTGKTHLAASIGNQCHTRGIESMFVVVPDLLDHLRATFSPASSVPYDRLFNEVLNTQLLILDDLGTQSATPWAREKLYQILNHRYNAELPTVITTTLTLGEIDPRIRSRMLDRQVCEILLLTVPPYLAPVGSDAGRGRKTAPRK
jgi:DNA replication protein DnaC